MNSTPFSPSPLRANLVIGFLGAGQLARMSAIEAFRYGLRVAAYSDRPAKEPAQWMTPHVATGSFDDPEAMTRFASECDLLTLENEFIDSELLRQVSEKSGTPLWPSPRSFSLIENKRIEKSTFEEAGIPVTPTETVAGPEAVIAFGNRHGWPVMLKSSKGGYDGYGNRTVPGREHASEAFRSLGGEKGREIIAEAFVDFRCELAVQVARSPAGTAVYPCCETVQENHICVAVRTPAPIDPKLRKEAELMAVAATEAIDGRGIFAYEFFLTSDDRLLLNESAPRPHNSGHYTIEGCVTSQFENHIRSLLGLPPGSTKLRRPAAVMVNLLGSGDAPAEALHTEASLQLEDAHLHLYGKDRSRPGRKMGHLTLLGDDPEELYRQARRLAAEIEI